MIVSIVEILDERDSVHNDKVTLRILLTVSCYYYLLTRRQHQ